MYFDEYLKMMNNPSKTPRMEIARFGRQNNTRHIRVLLHAKDRLNIKNFALLLKNDYEYSLHQLPDHLIQIGDKVCIYINAPQTLTCSIGGNMIFTHHLNVAMNIDDSVFVSLIYLNEIDVKRFEL